MHVSDGEVLGVCEGGKQFYVHAKEGAVLGACE